VIESKHRFATGPRVSESHPVADLFKYPVVINLGAVEEVGAFPQPKTIPNILRELTLVHGG